MIDANLLVLLIVGSADRGVIKGRTFKGLKEYGTDDYDLLRSFVTGAQRFVVTPHILAETSNLLSRTHDSLNRRLFTEFRGLLNDVELVDEIFLPSAAAANRPEFVWLGLTDAAALLFSEHDITLLTSDARLADAAGKARIDVINFNHHRTGL